jgi:hypothetical protein
MTLVQPVPASLDPPSAAPLVANLGFLASPDLPDRPGPAYLLVAVRDAPTLHHYDPEAVAYWVSDAGRGRRRTLTRATALPGAFARTTRPNGRMARLSGAKPPGDPEPVAQGLVRAGHDWRLHALDRRGLRLYRLAWSHPSRPTGSRLQGRMALSSASLTHDHGLNQGRPRTSGGKRS